MPIFPLEVAEETHLSLLEALVLPLSVLPMASDSTSHKCSTCRMERTNGSEVATKLKFLKKIFDEFNNDK